MDRLAADPGLRASMGREGRRLAVARFDQRIVLDRLLEVYAEAPARTGG
jgi:glycosyltransferase involved in cell wall biosynthesis